MSTTPSIAEFVDRIPFAILAINGGRTIEIANEAARQLFGERIRGADIAVAIREPSFTEALEVVLSTENGKRVDVELYRDTQRRFHISIEPRADAGGAIICLEECTEIDRARVLHRDFVANASHELRTPLATVMGCMDTLRGTARDDPDATEHFMKLMRAEVGRMQKVVSDLLSLNQIEFQEYQQPRTVVDVGALAKMVATAHQVDELQVPDQPLEVLGDGPQLSQALANLVDNAQHYGAGDVYMQVLVDAQRIGLLVGDRGPGIDAVHLPRLTERFYRVDVSQSRRQGGTGLGLAIVKHIVARHRGEFNIESELGRGSRFTIWLDRWT